jgi:hypothetical protein
MELTLIDVSNPIREWMECARSTVQPKLDEESPDTDAPIPSVMVTATAHPRDLQHHTGSSSVLEWPRKNISDSHRGKRKTYAMRPTRHNKRQKGKAVTSDGTIEESNDSNSKTDSDDGNDGDGTDGGTASLAAQETPHEQPLSPFTADQFIYCTQDQDHGGLESSRSPSHTVNAPIDSSVSSSHWINDVPITSPYKYHIPDIQSQQTTRWIYEWIESEFYNMCYQDWQDTAEWTHFTWQEHKAHLLRIQGIMLMSTDEYYAIQNAQPM